MKTTTICCVLLTVSLAVLTGCVGYTTQPLHRTDVKTVAVPIFQSQEFRRGLEFELSETLAKMIELRTPYKVVGRDRADTVITGTIQSLSENVVTEDTRDEATENVVAMSISYEWKDLRTGNVLRSGTPHQSWYFASSEGQTLRSAQTIAIRRIAEQIVEDMEKDW